MSRFTLYSLMLAGLAAAFAAVVIDRHQFVRAETPVPPAFDVPDIPPAGLRRLLPPPETPPENDSDQARSVIQSVVVD